MSKHNLKIQNPKPIKKKPKKAKQTQNGALVKGYLEKKIEKGLNFC